MGDKHIYDIISLYLPDHLKSSINTVRFITRRSNYEIIVDALEKYFYDMGMKPMINESGNGASKEMTLEKEGLCCQFQKVKL